MKKRRFRSMLKAINNYVVFFLTVAFAVSCCMMLFVSTLADSMGLVFNEENIGAAAKVTFLNVLLLTFLFGILAVVLLYIQISSSHILRSKHAWICKECGTVNFYSKSCTHCATQRISVKQTIENKSNPEKTLEKWTCPKCGQTNNSNAKKCVNCLHEKP